METMSVATALLLGAIQGLTEFLPVSSSGHLALAEHLFASELAESVSFDVAVHLATLVAVLIVFRARIAALFTTEKRKILLLAIATIPAAAIGMAFNDTITVAVKGNFYLLGASFLAGGLFMVWAERFAAGREPAQMTRIGALLTGFAQAFAIVPGISRSGSTVSAARALGVEKDDAVAFSFLMSIPVIGGAALLEMKDIGSMAAANTLPLAAGFLAALATGLVSVFILIAVVRRAKMTWFGIYCGVVGVAVLGLGLFG